MGENEVKYKAVMVPDFEKLRNLLEMAKGNNRTMGKFAKECGSNPTIFSRIMHKSIVKPLSEELVNAIVENTADDFVTMDRVMRANGMIREDEDAESALTDREYASDNQQRRVYFESAKNLIVKELYDRDEPIILFDSRSFRQAEVRFGLETSKYGLTYIKSNFSVKLQGHPTVIWNFICIYNLGLSEKSEPTPEICGRLFFSDFAELFLRDIWEKQDRVKHSFVFRDETEYNMVLECLSDIKVNNDISFILVNDEERDLQFIKEAILPRMDGKVHESIFEKEKIH